MVSSNRHAAQRLIVWIGKPWVIPSAVLRTVTVVVLAIFFLFLEMFVSVALAMVFGVPLFLWTLLAFTLAWMVSLVDLLIFWASHIYTLRQDGLEVRRGIVRLNSFLVTPSGFGDLLLYQSLAGRIFGYGDLTINSQGERQIKLKLVRSPFTTADIIRDVMGKPIIRINNHV